MRVLIIGGDGMLGHCLLTALASSHEVKVSLRSPLQAYAALGMFHAGNAAGGIDVRDIAAVRGLLHEFEPDAVVNAAGVVKQRGEASEAIPSIEINSLFPHRLAAECRNVGAALIHYSTDCVFSGSKGNYRESEIPDPLDLYGRSKLLGEVEADNCLTFRTSMVGLELTRKTGLIEWFLSQEGSVAGYTRAVFSGLTTAEHARVLQRVLAAMRNRLLPASGLFHLAGNPISKCELLTMLTKQSGLDKRIIPDDRLVVDRSLKASKFKDAYGYSAPSWGEMIDELAATLRSSQRCF